ncbi:MAG: M20 family metallopeptidase [Anaerovoracaceae bacterium]
MNLNHQKQEFLEIEKKYGSTFENICDFIFRNPELSGEEYIASSYLCDILNEHGFKSELGIAGEDTAFISTFKAGPGPNIAFIAEYDALPCTNPHDLKETTPGHTCGHNWIAAATVGAAICLSKMSDSFSGTISVIGTPAEETYGAKVTLIDAGYFDNVDIAFQPHLESFTDINSQALALDPIEFKFFGKSTHAASYPEEGINALDAINLLYSAIGLMRQQVSKEVRISGIIENGGDMPNIIPDYATAKFYIRALTRNELEGITKWVIDCAKGASLMTRTKMEYSFFENRFDELVHIDILQDVLRDSMVENGINQFTNSTEAPKGSSDIGNLSQKCPTIYFEVDIDSTNTFYTHDDDALLYVNSKYAYNKLHQVINIMGHCALKLYSDKKIVNLAKMKLNSITSPQGNY